MKLSRIAKAGDPQTAREAKALLKNTLDWVRRLQDALQTLEDANPPAAAKGYKKLAARLNGLKRGKDVEARLAGDNLKRQMRAWQGYERLLAFEKRLKKIKGAQARGTDSTWSKANAETIRSMTRIAAIMAEKYPDTAAHHRTQTLLSQYELPSAPD